jgi:hypothetical protein
MGQGAQSKALRIATQTQYGIDPTKIYDAQGNVVGDIANWDKAPELFKNQAGTGKLPPETPDPTYSPGEVDFQHVDTQGPQRATKNSDPFAGMGGAGG